MPRIVKPKKAKKLAPKKAAPKNPATLAPRTRKPDPEQSRGNFLYVSQRSAGVRVTEDTALTLGAVWACVRVISESLAGLPWLVHRARPDGGMDMLREHPVSWLLDKQASPETPAFQFRETILAHALTWGNGYAEIERDIAGRPVNLWLLTPDRVRAVRDRMSGQLYYEVTNHLGPPTILDAEDVYHLRGLGFDGLTGYSVIQLAARSIGAGIALDQATSEFFANDSTPGGYLVHPTRLSPQARKNIIDSWEARHRGASNRRKVAVLEEGLKWEQTGLPPEDTRLIEQRQFTPNDICRWFRVPPHKIGDLTRATFSNIEHQAIEFVNDTLRPWAERKETEADIKLFGRTSRGTLQTVIDLDELKRGDMNAQSEYATKMVNWGIFSINDGRKFIGRNPIGPDGEKRLVPVNMQLLEKAGEEPPASGSAVARTPEQMKALAPVFEDAFRRILIRESGRSQALKNGDRAAWFEKVKADHLGYVTGVLRPLVASVALASGVAAECLDPALAIIADRHLDQFRERLMGDGTGWESQSATLASSCLERLTAAVEVVR